MANMVCTLGKTLPEGQRWWDGSQMGRRMSVLPVPRIQSPQMLKQHGVPASTKQLLPKHRLPWGLPFQHPLWVFTWGWGCAHLPLVMLLLASFRQLLAQWGGFFDSSFSHDLSPSCLKTFFSSPSLARSCIWIINALDFTWGWGQGEGAGTSKLGTCK